MFNPHQVTQDFERALCLYTGARYAVAVNSCTAALMLAVRWFVKQVDATAPVEVEIPRRTYVSVPMSIMHAGGRPRFRDEAWVGSYQLKPFPVWDSARQFTSDMVGAGQMVCVSFHASKSLGVEQGGAILHDNPHADRWFRRMRFDGRTEGVAPKDDTFTELGWHCYINPSTSAQALLRLHSLPRRNGPLPNDDYPDLSTMSLFQ
jgi:dTDP-4-amino-4,6-dideoxygalactose transaminase